MRFKFKLSYWPILTSVWITISFIITYVISVCLEIVYPLFPYISETGAYHPASSVFGILMNIEALFAGITFYIRYRQIDFALRTGRASLSSKWNVVGFWMGHIVAFGICLVGNFQSDTSPESAKFVFIMHLVGALLAFGIGSIYMIIQTRISFGLRPVSDKHSEFQTGNGILYLRLLLTFLFFVFFFATFIGSTIARQHFTGDRSTWWTSEEGGYVGHLVSTFSEWLMVFVFIVYVLTLEKEFRSIRFVGIEFENKCVHISNDAQESLNEF